MKKMQKILSILLTTAMILAMVASTMLFSSAEEPTTSEEPDDNTVYTLDGFGTNVECGPFSFHYSTASNLNQIPNDLVKLTTIKDVSTWPASKRYLTEAEAALESGIPTHFYLEGSDKSAMSKVGEHQVIVFTAPTCGNYSYRVTARADWSGDAEVAVLVGGSWKNGARMTAAQAAATATDTFSLKKGETAYFIVRNTTGSGSDPVRLDAFSVTLTAKNHNPDEAVIENKKEHTCLDDGSYEEVINCADCGAEISRTTKVDKAPGQHTPKDAVKENEKPHTCLVDGSYEEVIYCSVCDEVISRTEKTDPAPGEHTPGEEKEEDGNLVVRCEVCNEIISSTCDHEAADAVKENVEEATCEHEGSYDEVVRCKKCDAVITSEHKTEDKLPHTPDEAAKENVVEATCEQEGSYDEVVRCTECDTVITSEHKTEDKLPHTPGETAKENVVEATCEHEGSYDEVVRCTECDTVITSEHKTEEQLSHTPGEAVKENIVASTEFSEGSYDEVVRCTKCNAVITSEHKTTPKLQLKKVAEHTLDKFGSEASFGGFSFWYSTASSLNDVLSSLKALNKVQNGTISGTPGTVYVGDDASDTFFHFGKMENGAIIFNAAGGCYNVVAFTAPEDGVYTYEMTAKAWWNNDTEIAVNFKGEWLPSVLANNAESKSASSTVEMKKGEVIYFIVRLTMGTNYDPITVENFKITQSVYTSSGDNAPTGDTVVSAAVTVVAVVTITGTALVIKKKRNY